MRQVALPDVISYVADWIRTTSVDLVHVEGYFMMQHVPFDIGVPIFLAEENIEYELDRVASRYLGAPGDDWRVTRSLEHKAWKRATLCGAVTDEDVATMKRDIPELNPHWLPPGCDHFSAAHTPADPCLPDRRPNVVFTGNANWPPTRDAIMYLVEEIWPRVLAHVPDAHLALAGSGLVPGGLPLREVPPSVHMLGALASFGPLLDAADVFVCPMRFGGGIKSKILESIYAGCAIVTTAAGGQGLPDAVRNALVIADEPDDFAGAVVHLLTDQQSRNELRSKTAEVAHLLPTWDEAADRLVKAWHEALSDGTQRASPSFGRPR
jgi:glycosyltransferase involved in cell wall biosynthesis